MGQEFAAKLSQVNQGTGVKNGENSYDFTFTSNEKQHLREIVCPSEDCFASFYVQELRKSVFTIPDASVLAWEYMELGADDRQTTFTPSPTINPTVWNSNPTVYANDYNSLLNLFESIGNVTSFDIEYNSIEDEVVITAFSNDTSYSAMLIDDSTYSSVIDITLNFISTLSAPIANSGTTLELTDSDGTVFDTGYGLPIGLQYFSGTTDNFTIDASALYPTGTTFTFGVSNLDCADITYIYLYEETISSCSASNSYDFYKGNLCKINIPTIQHDNDTPRFQNIHLTLNGNVFSMYQKIGDWHDSYSKFQSDFLLLMATISSDIDVTSIEFTDLGTSVDVSFRTQNIVNDDVNPFFRQFVRGYESPTGTTLGWTQSRVLNLVTNAPYPSTISITDEFTNEIVGENLDNITSNDFTLSPLAVTSNESVDNVGIVWGFDDSLPYDEESVLDTQISAQQCLIPDFSNSFSKCYESFTSEQVSYFQNIYLVCTSGSTILGDSFTIEYNNGSFVNQSFTIPFAVTPSENFQYLTKFLNDIRGMRVISMDFSPVDRQYIINLELDNGFTLISLQENTNDRLFTINPIYPIYLNSTNRLNPYISLNWGSIPTIVPSSIVGTHNMTYGYWEGVTNTRGAVSIDWSVTGDTIYLEKINDVPSTEETYFTITLHETYPTDSNAVAEFVLPATYDDVTFTGITAELVASGSTVGNINFVLYTNYLGWGYVYPIDMSLDFFHRFDEYYYYPLVWGTLDKLKYVGTAVTSTEPTVTSVVCGENCCGENAPSTSNITLDYTNVGVDTYSVELTTSEPITCGIEYFMLDLTPQLGSPTIDSGTPLRFNSLGCINGVQEFEAVNTILFTGDPTGFDYLQQISYYDADDILIGSYTQMKTF